MSSSLPGMDLYLEQPAFWSSFHSRFIVAIADAVELQLSPQYYVEVETRVYQAEDSGGILIGIPDVAVVSSREGEAKANADQSSDIATQVRPQAVQLPMPLEIKERYLEIRDTDTDAVISTIELLSPSNKRQGKGRMEYERKRQTILGSATHLIELDLLRSGEPMPMLGLSTTTYRILVSRSSTRPTADLYGIQLWQSLPDIPIPLRSADEEPIISLQSVFDSVYERGRYATRIDYRKAPPSPKLLAAEQQWLDTQNL